MKTRIISGVVMVALVAAVLFGACYYPVILTVFLAAVSMIACYEMLHTAVGINNKIALTGAEIYSFLSIFAISGYFPIENSGFILTVIFFVFSAIMVLKNHNTFGVKEIISLIGAPIIITYGFGCLEAILNHSNGIFYLLLLLNFSSICDCGAYFTGVTIGKHKLCPEISPKKTVEGAAGGIVLSLIFTVIILLSYGLTSKLIIALILTIPFCILGMIGDLFASVIKRAAGIKDYGKLIPGHGGILDRVDSILMITPVLYIFITAGII